VKVEYLKNFTPLQKRDKRYYLFRAFLICLNSEETVELLKRDFSQDKLIRFLITKKIIQDLKGGFKKYHEDLVEEILESIKSLSTYHRKQAGSKFLTEIFDCLDSDYQKSIISYLIDSPYINDRKRAYFLLDKKFDNSYVEKLLEHLHTYNDGYPLEIIIKYCSKKVLNDNFNLIDSHFDDDSLEYDWQLLKLRTKFYSKLYYLKKSLIEGVKRTDPVTYLYIMKELKKKVDPKLAWEAYRTNPRNSLFRLFADLGLWDVLTKIDQTL
jgi:hypothetical protein